ncbi:dihydrodipicolinate synthase family protein [Oceanomicrobium pacificus]|uniref:Dihydrodipicolinate synthase family protein n=1 Tax=Oceanomicrobium pacificus TaxID=2692916 RepID=A0A6B0TKP2_9RHOB|nr:dihydrodipicolinate synthase family protein [Oceanomicrobium pacificus]MXU65080.1 dihydrodipicolinate synthase family protein [Oceanomicrobium pacificus]
MTKRHGIYPILYAFWDDHGRLDRDAMARQVDYCIDQGAHGIAVLGLVTEVHKMDVNERLNLVEMVGAQIAGRVPYAVTVAEPSIEGQIAFSRAAAGAGADWVILQPPPIKGTSAADLIRFFGTVADAIDIGVAVQNNPVNLDVALSAQGLIDLHKAHPNISLLKGEGWSVDIARVIEGSDGAFAVFGGHGGIEFPALLASGGAGLIPAPDFLPAQIAMYEAWRAGDRAGAMEIHRRLLPAIVFMSRSVPGMLCYGKRLFAEQAGITISTERTPALQPTEFGLAQMAEFAADIAQAARLRRPTEAA